MASISSAFAELLRDGPEELRERLVDVVAKLERRSEGRAFELRWLLWRQKLDREVGEGASRAVLLRADSVVSGEWTRWQVADVEVVRKATTDVSHSRRTIGVWPFTVDFSTTVRSRSALVENEARVAIVPVVRSLQGDLRLLDGFCRTESEIAGAMCFFVQLACSAVVAGDVVLSDRLIGFIDATYASGLIPIGLSRDADGVHLQVLIRA